MILVGTAGADTIRGDGNVNILTGGAGRDTSDNFDTFAAPMRPAPRLKCDRKHRRRR